MRWFAIGCCKASSDLFTVRYSAWENKSVPLSHYCTAHDKALFINIPLPRYCTAQVNALRTLMQWRNLHRHSIAQRKVRCIKTRLSLCSASAGERDMLGSTCAVPYISMFKNCIQNKLNEQTI